MTQRSNNAKPGEINPIRARGKALESAAARDHGGLCGLARYALAHAESPNIGLRLCPSPGWTRLGEALASDAWHDADRLREVIAAAKAVHAEIVGLIGHALEQGVSRMIEVHCNESVDPRSFSLQAGRLWERFSHSAELVSEAMFAITLLAQRRLAEVELAVVA